MEDGESQSLTTAADEGSGYVPTFDPASSPYSTTYKSTIGSRPDLTTVTKNIATHEINLLNKHLTSRTDKIENITWVRSRQVQRAPYLEVYSGELGGAIALRLAAETYGTTRLDIEQIVLNVDGEILRIPLDSQNSKISAQAKTERSPLGGVVTRVWYKESIDIVVSSSPEIMGVLTKIPSSSSTAVRLRGRNGSLDFNMSSASKNALSTSIRYYEARKTLLMIDTPFLNEENEEFPTLEDKDEGGYAC